MIGAPQCINCLHYLGVTQIGKLICTAFPEGVPQVIFLGMHNHVRPYPGDHDIQFEPRTPEVAARVALSRQQRRKLPTVTPEAAHLSPGHPVYQPEDAGEEIELRDAADRLRKLGLLPQK